MCSANRADNRSSGRINEEQVSVDALRDVLLNRCGCRDVRIEPNRADPPDFYVTIDRKRFPTEVTSIVLKEEMQRQGHMKRLIACIRNRSLDEGCRLGQYILICHARALIPSPNTKGHSEICEKAVDYICNTQNQDTDDGIQLAGHELRKIRIEKLSGKGQLNISGSNPNAKWEGEIQNDLTALIQMAIKRKKSKLEHKGIPAEKAILVLYDAYIYAEPKHAIKAIQQVNGYHSFHSVFWAYSFILCGNGKYPGEPTWNGLFLYSKNASWDQGGTVPC